MTKKIPNSLNSTENSTDLDRPPVPTLSVPQGITPFFLAESPVRGRLVRLGVLTDCLLERHDNHPVISKLAGQALALVGGMATALKFQGSFSMQIKGDGPVSILVADATDEGALRFYVKTEQERLEDILSLTATPMARTLTGEGFLAFTIDQGSHSERHQGIVAIEGPDLSDMAEHYFKTSEQHDCKIFLACQHTPQGWRAGALILERIANEGGTHHNTVAQSPTLERWETALALAHTLQEDELLEEALSPETLLHRLFHAEGLQLGTPKPLSYGCRCSRSRLLAILEQFGAEELDHMQQDNDIIMNCEFCNYSFTFNRHDIHSQSQT
ncbi:Hsp33 family molecular chaperone HslO [Entomobacter blattae]|uniref:33 kDa chaperonin n=1 Tax=Entomobacter blattae TaxID=2762277 RepID=A0A7H1NUR5_9PROT|nr:Hsp33 family molecular chaperone HslO [Entomobacter blattae]QNT79525.1 33 kDa chaperonin [Entomobacter blattae]